MGRKTGRRWGIPMATPGEKNLPPVGNSDGHPWGESHGRRQGSRQPGRESDAWKLSVRVILTWLRFSGSLVTPGAREHGPSATYALPIRLRESTVSGLHESRKRHPRTFART